MPSTLTQRQLALTMPHNAGPSTFELGWDGPAKILVGMDGCNAAWRALHYAIGLARRQTSEIVAVHAIEIPSASYAAPEAVAHLQDFSRQLGVEVRSIGHEHGVDIIFITSDSHPVTALLTIARDHHVDLIVVGVSNKITHRLYGSVATRTIKARYCPVTVVP